MEKSGLLNEQKAEDENIVTEIIALIHKVYNTDEYLKEGGTGISELEDSIKDPRMMISKNPSDRRKLSSSSASQTMKREQRSQEKLRTNGPSATQLVSFVKVPAQADVSASGSAALAFVSPVGEEVMRV